MQPGPPGPKWDQLFQRSRDQVGPSRDQKKLFKINAGPSGTKWDQKFFRVSGPLGPFPRNGPTVPTCAQPRHASSPHAARSSSGQNELDSFWEKFLVDFGQCQSAFRIEFLARTRVQGRNSPAKSRCEIAEIQDVPMAWCCYTSTALRSLKSLYLPMVIDRRISVGKRWGSCRTIRQLPAVSVNRPLQPSLENGY